MHFHYDCLKGYANKAVGCRCDGFLGQKPQYDYQCEFIHSVIDLISSEKHICWAHSLSVASLLCSGLNY